jgi:hypothetical protein
VQEQVSAALGSAIHGGYDLANGLHPPAALNTDLPNPVDPRGLLTFGVAGLGLLLLARLKTQEMRFPRGLAYPGYASAALLVILYLGCLIILQAISLVIVIPALLEGFVVNPPWYAWLGLNLIRSRNPSS